MATPGKGILCPNGAKLVEGIAVNDMKLGDKVYVIRRGDLGMDVEQKIVHSVEPGLVFVFKFLPCAQVVESISKEECFTDELEANIAMWRELISFAGWYVEAANACEKKVKSLKSERGL